MKIMHIIPNLYPAGAETFCINLCNNLVSYENNKIVLLTFYDLNTNSTLIKSISNNVKLISLGKKTGIKPFFFLAVYKIIKQENPDIINTHLNGLFYSSLFIMLNKIKVFHTVHNMADKETILWKRKLYKILFHYFNVYPVAISKSIKDTIVKEYGLLDVITIENGTPQLKISSSYNIVKNEIDSYKNTKSTKVFLNIGRISPQKNQMMLIEVFNKLIDEGNDVVLLIIGKDPTDDQKYKIPLESKINDNIFLLGEKSNIGDYLALSNAFCLSSLYEGLPITLLESLSIKTIPICTPVGGIADVIIDGFNGFLSTDITKKTYYEKISQFLNLNNDNLIEIKHNAEITFKNNYSIELTAANYLYMYSHSKSN